MSATLDEALIRYLEARSAQRAADIEAALAACTPRERDLIREAAVMGYVRGSMAAPLAAEDIPPDRQIVALVVHCCLSMPEIYPAFRRAHRRAARRAASASA